MKRLSCLGILAISSFAQAAEWKIDGNINQDLSFNDNVRMQKNAQSSFIYRVTPVLNFAHRTAISEVLASASYGTQQYLNVPALSAEVQRYSLNGFYLTERSRLGLNASYNQRPIRNTAEQDSGNFSSNSQSTTWSVSPLFSYKLTELDSLAFSPSYSETTQSSRSFSNNHHANLSLAWEHVWTQRYSSSLSFSYSKFDSDRIGSQVNSDTYSVNFLNTFRWSENLTLKGSIGGRLTESENTTIIGVEKYSSTGFLADIGFNYKGENYSASLNLNRSLMPQSTGQLSEQTGIRLNLLYNITERLSTTGFASYQTTRSASSSQNTTNGSSRKNLSFGTALNWQMARDWTVSANYTYQQQNIKDYYNTNANVFMVSINYNWQGFSLSR